jgi:hypothetical protein
MESDGHKEAGLPSAGTFWVTEICIITPLGGVEKVLFNHEEHKECTKGTKLKPCNSVLCDLCVEPL